MIFNLLTIFEKNENYFKNKKYKDCIDNNDNQIEVNEMDEDEGRMRDEELFPGILYLLHV